MKLHIAWQFFFFDSVCFLKMQLEFDTRFGNIRSCKERSRKSYKTVSGLIRGLSTNYHYSLTVHLSSDVRPLSVSPSPKTLQFPTCSSSPLQHAPAPHPPLLPFTLSRYAGETLIKRLQAKISVCDYSVSRYMHIGRVASMHHSLVSTILCLLAFKL